MGSCVSRQFHVKRFAIRRHRRFRNEAVNVMEDREANPDIDNVSTCSLREFLFLEKLTEQCEMMDQKEMNERRENSVVDSGRKLDEETRIEETNTEYDDLEDKEKEEGQITSTEEYETISNNEFNYLEHYMEDEEKSFPLEEKVCSSDDDSGSSGSVQREQLVSLEEFCRKCFEVYSEWMREAEEALSKSMRELDKLSKDVEKHFRSLNRHRGDIIYPPLVGINKEDREEVNATSMEEFQ